MERDERQAAPEHIDLKKDEALTLRWGDGRVSRYPVGYLRKMSPSADMRELRSEMDRNPLTVLPTKMGGHEGPIEAASAELVGNYAIRIRFTDGHDTGIFSWGYLRRIDPGEEGAGGHGDG